MRRNVLSAVPICVPALAALLLAAGSARAPVTAARVIHVDCANATGVEDGTEAHPYDTIQEGINAATDGDTVLVHPCTYHENIDFTGKAIAVTSTDPLDPQVVAATVIDGGGAGSVARLAWAETAVLSGFTITNGCAVMGGGVYVIGSSPVVTHNVIVGNQARGVTGDSGSGGGIYWSQSLGVISHNRILHNDGAREGAGIYCGLNSSPSIHHNVISGNGADYQGGGIRLYSCLGPYPPVLVANNLIAGNGATVGGGIDCASSRAIVIGNTIVSNSGWAGGALHTYNAWSLTIANNIIAFCETGIWFEAVPSLVLRHNCVYGNGGDDYSGWPDPTGTDGNISQDPQLVSLSYGDLHIQPGSPCRNAGDSSLGVPDDTDIDGQPRVQGAAIDIGADESDGTLWPVTTRVVRVRPDGDDAHDGSSWPLAKRTVQAAIDALAVGGGEVWVAAAVYQERISLPAYVHVYGGFVGGEVLRSQRDWAAHETVLDGSGAGSVVTSVGAGYLVSTLDGFTVRDGESYYGGGVYCRASSPIVAHSALIGNHAQFGGAVYCLAASPQIADGTIIGNVARNGAGIYSDSNSSANIVGNLISSNVAVSNGGGVFCSEYCTATASANTITDNEARYGGGICCGEYSLPVVSGNYFAGNRASYGGGVYCGWYSRVAIIANAFEANQASEGGGAIACAQATVTITDNAINANSGGGAGGGISCRSYSDGSVARNVITNNTAQQGGGVSYSDGASPSIEANTVSGNSAQKGAGVACAYNSGPVISGNTVSGNAATQQGGGIFCTDTSYPTISSNTIAQNTAGTYGGGIACEDYCSPAIAGNAIAQNTAGTYGGGIGCQQNCSPEVTGNTVHANTAGRGGGIWCADHSSPVLATNVIFANRGGGVGCYQYCSPTITACTIADNIAGTGDGLYCQDYCSVTVCGSIIWNRVWAVSGSSVGITYSDLRYASPGEGNISAAPEFVDPTDGDYHLLPTSPCLDVGLNACAPGDDIDGQPRPWPPGGIADMGADEVMPPPTCDITLSPANPTTDDVIVFDSGAADPYDLVTSITWDFGDGGAASGDPVGHQYAMPGSYPVSVTVCNAAGLCASCTSEVAVAKGANIPPVCEVAYQPDEPQPGEAIAFTADASDPNPWGEIVACDWDFGDGDVATGNPVTHAYAGDGTFTVCATVTDDQGGQATCCTQVTVTWPCECDVAIDRTHCTMPAAGHVGQCKAGQIGARNRSLTESCEVMMRVTDSAGNVVFETAATIGPGRTLRARFDHCYTADEIGRGPWTWEVWPAGCSERTPWDNAYGRRVNVHP
jgi:parallel beta-helix repeat protein/predicted outer membrane repeat protein